MKRQTWNKDICERLFVFNNNGTLKSFARGYKEYTNNRIQGEFYYKFNHEGELLKVAENFKGGNITINGKHDIYVD